MSTCASLALNGFNSKRLHRRFMPVAPTCLQHCAGGGLKHIVVAAGASKESRAATLTAMRWGARAGARVTILRIHPLPAPIQSSSDIGDGEHQRPSSPDAVEHWLPADIQPEPSWSQPEIATAVGVPGVEIARFAEDSQAGLLVLGREGLSAVRHTKAGDALDAVARRSRVPCLFVSAPLGVPRRLLVALAATKQGYRVYATARRIAGAIGAELDIVTVEPRRHDEPPEAAGLVPDATTMKLQQLLDRDGAKVRIRRGPVVPEILAELEASGAQTLVIGYHRGGLPTELRTGSIGRTLAGLAPCAVLTVPL
jgi:nucleotide-binding universal stress UspA family protein